MANWFSDNSQTKFRVTVPKYFFNKPFTDYEVLVQFPSNINWKLRKRYSEFLKLYDELASLDSNFKVYFPPKQMFKAKSEYILTQRKRSLEMYMNEIISIINNYVPRPLAKFLEMEKYEIHGITTNLAKMLFKHGESLLSNNRIFEISILSIYSINQRMISPAPTNIYNKPSEDFGNVLEVIESTKKIKIVPYNVLVHGSDSLYGTSNIKSESLPFDISIFNGVQSLELNSVKITNLKGLYKMNAVVENLKAHYCLKSLEDILFGDLVHRSSNIEDLRNFYGPWMSTKSADFSNNSITHIDKSIVTLKQVSNLNLSFNQISEIDNLHYLIFLTELDLSNNCLYLCENISFSNKLGSVKKLILKGNKLSKLNVIDRMFSLEYLDVSDNNICEFKGLLPLCRLSCLENLFIKRNPICSNESFISVIFDIFLDQMDSIKINSLSYDDLPVQTKQEISNRRHLKESTMFDFNNLQTQFECSGEICTNKDDRNLLMSIDIDMENISKKESILYIPELYNILIYWYFTAVKRAVLPSKILWCTEIFPPNLCMRPVPVLIISCNTLSASILQCSLKVSANNSSSVLTIRPHRFYDINKSLRNLVIGADKMFIRFDMNNDNRYLYLINNSHFVDSFMGHLYHIDDEIVKFGDSRLIFLNEDDRMESLRRFIDVWRLDLVGNLLRSGNQRNINTNTESEILFCSRAMLKMQNGFHLLLTIVVTRQLLCLVDERIYDWPDLVRPTSCTDLATMTHYSPQTSSSNQFQFLRINAYFFHQIKSCIQQPAPLETLLGTWTPTFSHSLQIAFNPISSNLKEPIRLHFETIQKSDNACQIINQICENEELPTVISSSEPVSYKHVPQEIPSFLKHLNSSFQEIRLNLSLFCPKLSTIALSPIDEIVSFCYSKIEILENSKIFGILWTKFIYYKFDSNDEYEKTKEESPCLLCISPNQIHIIYETEEPVLLESECWSDPESDQPDVNNNPTKLNILSIYFDDVFKIFIGLYHQWITLCCRSSELESENRRLILIMRNTDQSKQLVNWIKSSFKDQSLDERLSEKLEYAHDDGNIDELLFQIRKVSRCEDIDLIHYTSIEDARIELPSISRSITNDSTENFTYAVVITSSNISIIRHNIVEFPVRYFGPGAVRQSPFHMQYQMMRVVPLYECVQIQLPGHDKNLLIIIIQSHCQNNSNSTYKIQLSVACQKEQKHLIDKLRQQWTKCLQTDVPLRVIVC